MTTLAGLSDQPKQQSTFVLPDGSQVSLYLEYIQQQAGWFANISRGTFTVNGLRLTASPNLLRKWQNGLPFGLALLTKNAAEPTTLDTFVDGTTSLLVLNAADIAAINAAAYPGN